MVVRYACLLSLEDLNTGICCSFSRLPCIPARPAEGGYVLLQTQGGLDLWCWVHARRQWPPSPCALHRLSGSRLGGEHGVRSMLRASVLDNMCPACHCIFASRYAAQQHLVSSVSRNGFCTRVGSLYATRRPTKRTICHLCSENLCSVERLRVHIRLAHLAGAVRLVFLACVFDLLSDSDGEPV